MKLKVPPTELSSQRVNNVNHDPDKFDGSELQKSGPEIIKAFLKTLPPRPGVYRMLNAKGQVLYVGKARNLKKRVQSYTRMMGHTNRIAQMILLTSDMEFITTASEADALLLEANLIKRLKPRFNVVLRDDKSFPYILIARDHDFPQILKHRGARNRKGDYYGPFASAGAVNRTINALQRAFLLRSCSDSVYENRSRPCLLHQIKRCSAPCTDEIPAQEYSRLVEETAVFLSGRSKTVQGKLAQLMETASNQLDFEQAAIYRDRIAALSHIQAHQGINPKTVKEADIFALNRAGGQICIQVFFFRAGQNWGNRAYFPRADKSHEEAEILESFLAQFYDDKPVPRTVLLSHKIPAQALLQEALTVKSDGKVEVLTPQRGEKRQLVAQAQNNAREALERRMAETASHRKLMAGIAKIFDLEHPPERIEIYDNSHIQGSHPIGAMVVAGPEGFLKNQYRKFNIKDTKINPGDDYAMMREVMTRRFSRLLRQNDPALLQNEHGNKQAGEAQWPDLLIIDGGKGQLSCVEEVLGELGIENLKVVSIAKGPDRNAGREHFHMKGKAAFMLEQRDPVLYYTQRLRDEAHRFAIGSHRARRKKAFGKSPLDEIAGIGPGRKKSLLRHFGSAKAVSRSGLTDLEAVNGINKSMAKTIYDHFHNISN